MPDTSRLSDADRSKLDSIVQQMEMNKESSATIQTLVDDFKQKYAKPPTFWETHPQTASLTRGALNTLPLIGMAGGAALAAPAALASGPAAPLVDMAGAGLGAGAGTGARNFLSQELGLEKPTGLVEGSRDVGRSTIESALVQRALPATGKAAQQGIRATARGLGGAAEATGKASGFPLRVMGTSRMLQGNPVGAALVAAPKLLEKGGTALKEWGEADPAFMAKTIEGFTKPTDPAAADLTKPEQRVLRMADPKNPAIRARILGNTKVGKEANKNFEEAMIERNLSRYDELQDITANKAREGAVEKAKQGLEAQPPVVSESVSTQDALGRRKNVRTSYKAPKATAAEPTTEELLRLKYPKANVSKIVTVGPKQGQSGVVPPAPPIQDSRISGLAPTTKPVATPPPTSPEQQGLRDNAASRYGSRKIPVGRTLRTANAEKRFASLLRENPEMSIEDAKTQALKETSDAEKANRVRASEDAYRRNKTQD